jgi:two-component system, NtrC family, sensor histidine kinase HydH
MSPKFVLRMTAPLIGISLLLLGVGIVSAWYVHRLQKQNSELLARDVASMLAAEDLEIKMREVRSNVSSFLREGKHDYLHQIPPLRVATKQLVGTAKESATTPHELELLARIERGRSRFFSEIDDRTKSNGSELRASLSQLLTDHRLEREIFGPAREYVDFHRQVVARSSEQSQIMADRMGLGLLLLGLCGSAAGVLAGFGIARGISRSIVQLSIPVHGAAGKLNEVVGPITLSTGGGFEELEVALQNMADHIGTVVERLEQREREVLRGEQLAAVGQLAAGIAHELRNPLMAIKILVQAAAEREDGGGLRGRDLAVVDEEICRLDSSIQSLLDFARPPRPSTALVDLRQLVNQTLDLVSARAEQQRVALRRDSAQPPAFVEVDSGQIRQVLLNLLLNSLDAMPGGGNVRLQIRPAPADRSGSTDAAWLTMTGENSGYLIQIADSGCGLPEDLGDRIFEPFISTKETGTGLGLPICRRIIAEHGGWIGAENHPAGGAIFSIWLPAAERAALGGSFASAGGVPALTSQRPELLNATSARS